MPHHCSKLHKDSWVFPPSSSSVAGKGGRRNMSKSGLQGGSWNEDHHLMDYNSAIPCITCLSKCRNLRWTLFDSTVTQALQGFCDSVFYQSIFEGTGFVLGPWLGAVLLVKGASQSVQELEFYSKFFFRIAKNKIEISKIWGIRPFLLRAPKIPSFQSTSWIQVVLAIGITCGSLIWGFLYLTICDPLENLDSYFH